MNPFETVDAHVTKNKNRIEKKDEDEVVIVILIFKLVGRRRKEDKNPVDEKEG